MSCSGTAIYTLVAITEINGHDLEQLRIAVEKGLSKKRVSDLSIESHCHFLSIVTAKGFFFLAIPVR